MDILKALILGAVEGLTEFLPVSSTGHLLLVGHFLGFESTGKSFEVLVQLGAILAILLVYFNKLLAIAKGLPSDPKARRFVLCVLVAFLPAAIIGFLFHKTITTLLFNPWVVSVALILGGIAIIAIEKLRPAPSIHSVPEIGPLAAVLVGLGQALAMIPGTSRSGATIITALLIGVERRTAAEFSFMLAIPTMFAASFYSLWKVRSEIDPSAFGQISVGFIAAFVVAFFTVRAVLALIGRIGFTPFGYYRIALGTLMLAVLAFR